MADATEPVLLRRDADGICFLALNRPAARNALNAELFLALDREIAALAAEPDTTGVVVLSGSGSCFSAGNDIGSLGHASKLPSPHFQAEVLERIEALPQVVVAAVHGYCMTGALELVLACDLIVAADTARFRDTHGQLGLLPHWGMTQRLPRMVGLQQARRMMYSGQPVTGEQAVGKGDVKPDPGARGVVPPGFDRAQTLFQVGPARAEHDELRALVQDPVGRLQDQVHAFLVVEAADKRDERRVGLFGQPQLALQRGLVGRFAGFPAGRVVRDVAGVGGGDEVRVGGRVPLADVDAVRHAGERPPPPPQHGVQPPPPFLRLHLPRVPVGHGDDAGGGLDAGFKHVRVEAADGVVERERGGAVAVDAVQSDGVGRGAALKRRREGGWRVGGGARERSDCARPLSALSS